MSLTSISAVADAIAAIGQGRMVVVVDGEEHRGESHVVMASAAATPETVAFLTAHSPGTIWVALPPEGAAEPPPAPGDAPPAAGGKSSPADLSAAISALADAAGRLHPPVPRIGLGRVIPVWYRRGGVLEHAGPREAAADLVRAAGLAPAAVLCGIGRRPGASRPSDAERFAERHGLPMVSVAELVRYRLRTDKVVRRVSEARIPTHGGDYRACVYESVVDGQEHLALVKGAIRPDVLVRVHSECLTGDVFGSLRCDCGPQLHAALQRIDREGAGVVVYLRGHEGRGIGLADKIQAYRLQEQGHDTVDANLALGHPADSRQYGVGAQILVDLGVTTMRLMTNNPTKRDGLEGFGLEVTERVPIEASPNPENLAYLRTKRERMGHLLGGLDLDGVV